uniref:Uncharacterized protein n=1 Tax=Anguilla anguilla TaxID=7936 RepID=A0A0E9RQ49_ANGAN
MPSKNTKIILYHSGYRFAVNK